MVKKTEKKEINRTLEGKRKFNVPIFADEFSKFDLDEDTTTFDAQTKVREALNLPKRQRPLTAKSQLRKKLAGLTNEEAEKLLSKM